MIYNTGGCKGVVDVELTEAGKNTLQEHHPQGIPHMVDGKPTIRKVLSDKD